MREGGEEEGGSWAELERAEGEIENVAGGGFGGAGRDGWAGG